MSRDDLVNDECGEHYWRGKETEDTRDERRRLGSNGRLGIHGQGRNLGPGYWAIELKRDGNTYELDRCRETSVGWVSDRTGIVSTWGEHIARVTCEQLRRDRLGLPLGPATSVGSTASGETALGVWALIRNYMQSLGFAYDDWQIATFTTSLQTKGFAILSGISGTGKTKLVQHFAAMLPEPGRVRVPVAQADEIVITIQPYMLKYGRFVVPARLFDRYALPDATELAEPEFEIGSIKHPCRMYQHHRGEAVVSFALLRGQVRQQFL